MMYSIKVNLKVIISWRSVLLEGKECISVELGSYLQQFEKWDGQTYRLDCNYYQPHKWRGKISTFVI